MAKELTQEERSKNTKNFFMKLGWILFFVLLAFVLGMIYKNNLVGASPTWPLNKTQTCTMFNFTGTACDSYWCVNFLEGNWTNDGLCFKNATLTVIINNTINNTTNSTNVTTTINTTSINVGTYPNANNTNGTNNSNQSVVAADWKNYVDNQTLQLRDSMADRLDNISALITMSNAEQQQPTNLWAVFAIVAVVMAGLVYMSVTHVKAKKYAEAGQYKKVFVNANEFQKQADAEDNLNRQSSQKYKQDYNKDNSKNMNQQEQGAE